MKPCPQCRIIKKRKEYYIRSNGHYSWCRECCAEKSREYYYRSEENRQKVIANSRKWESENKERKKELNRKYYLLNEEIIKKRAAEWAERNRGRRKEIIKDSYQKNKSKYIAKEKAGSKLSWAIIKGDIEKESCIICGSEISQAHHPDYNKPYSIIWLCQKHHAGLHALKRKMKDQGIMLEEYI